MSDTTISYPDPFEVFRLSTFVLSDYNPRGTADAAYLFGHTPDNEVATLSAAKALYDQGSVQTLLITGGGPYIAPNIPDSHTVAYNGGPAWRAWLVENGVRDNNILYIPRPELSHTATEAYFLARFAKEEGWRTLYLVTAPTHMLRAFANMVAAINRVYPELRVYCRPGHPMPWHTNCKSSQGDVEGTRFDTTLPSEWARLNKLWGNEYDIADAQEVRHYIERRDKP